MPYCTIDDISPTKLSEEELSRLTDEEPNVINIDVVEQAIFEADSIIDSYLGKKLKVPIESVPDRVVHLSTTIAIYLMWSRRSNRSGMDETVRQNYEDAIKFLEQFAEGLVSIGIDPPPVASSSQGAKSTANDRTFTKDSLKGF